MLHLESRSPQALFAPPSPPLLLGRWSRGGGSLLSGAPCIVLSGPCPLHPRCLRLRSALHGKHLKLSVQFSAKGRQTACIGKPSSAFWHTKVPAVLIGKSQSYSRFFFKNLLQASSSWRQACAGGQWAERPPRGPSPHSGSEHVGSEGRWKVPKAPSS